MFITSKVYYYYYYIIYIFLLLYIIIYRQIQETRKEILRQYTHKDNLYNELKSSTDGFSVIASYFGKGLFSHIPEGEPEFSIKQQEQPVLKESDDKMKFEPIPDIPAIVEESAPEVPEVPEDKSYLDQPVGGLDSWGQHYDDDDNNPFGEEPSATKPDLPKPTEKRIYYYYYIYNSNKSI